jgi:hypothetical protein
MKVSEEETFKLNKTLFEHFLRVHKKAIGEYPIVTLSNHRKEEQRMCHNAHTPFLDRYLDCFDKYGTLIFSLLNKFDVTFKNEEVIISVYAGMNEYELGPYGYHISKIIHPLKGMRLKKRKDFVNFLKE